MDGPREQGGYYWQMVEAVAKKYHIDLDAPVASLSEEKLNVIMFGTKAKPLTLKWKAAMNADLFPGSF
jgi:excinuclease ABC subunit A